MPKPYFGKTEFKDRGVNIPIEGFIRANPALSAAATKIVPDNSQLTMGMSNYVGQDQASVDYLRVTEMAFRIANRIKDAETVKALLPDLSLALNILIASIISPNDMLKSETTFKSDASIVGLTADTLLRDVVKEYFTKDYPIAQNYSKWLHEILGRSGAKVLAVLPESTIDDIINSDTRLAVESESFDQAVPWGKNGELKSKGFLGNAENERAKKYVTPAMAMESLRIGDYTEEVVSKLNVDLKKMFSSFSNELKLGSVTPGEIHISDNYDLLKLPTLQDKQRKSRIWKNTFRGFGMEDSFSDENVAVQKEFSKLTDAQIKSLFERNRNYTRKPVVIARSERQLNRRTIGAGTVMEFNTEAVFPIHAPGDKSALLGVYVLLDAFGYPIDLEESMTTFEQMMAGMSSTDSSTGGQSMVGGNSNYAMQQNSRNEYLGNGLSQRMMQFGIRAREFGRIVENTFTQKLKNNIFPDGAEVTGIDQIGRVMLARSLAQQQTVLLFLPSEMVTYIAFDYDANGFGRSLLDQARIITSRRIQLDMANTLGSIKNSVGLTDIDVKFDERTKDVNKAIWQVVDSVVGGRANQIPTGLIDPPLVTYFLQRMGLRFTFEGAPGLPDTKISYSETNTNYVKPDQDLADSVKKQTHQAIKVPSELIDTAESPDFATVAVKSSIMFSKNVKEIQDNFTPQVTKHVHQVIMANQELYDEMRKIIVDNFDSLTVAFTDEEKIIGKAMSKDALISFIVDKVLFAWIHGMEVTLPSPDNTTIANQLEILKDYGEYVDTALEAFISADIFNEEMAGSTQSGKVEKIVPGLKAAIMRKFISERNILPEVADLFTYKEEETEKVDALPQISQYIDTLLPRFFKFAAARKIVTDTLEKKYEEIGVEAGSSSSDSGSSNTEGGESSGDDGFNFDFGDDTSDTGASSDAGGSEPSGPSDEGGGGDEGATETEPAQTEGTEPENPEE